MVKKNAEARTIAAKRTLIDPTSSHISIQRQCELLGLSRSGYYYQGRGESRENIALMHRIDKIFTTNPFKNDGSYLSGGTAGEREASSAVDAEDGA